MLSIISFENEHKEDVSQSPPVGTELTLLCAHQSEAHSTGVKGGKSMEVRKWKMEFGSVKET